MKKINMIIYWDIVIVLQPIHLHIYIPVRLGLVREDEPDPWQTGSDIRCR